MMAGTPHCPFAYLLARTRSGWRAPSFPADRRVLKPPHHVKVARRRGGRAGGTVERVGRGVRAGGAGVLKARHAGDVHLPVSVRLYKMQMRSNGMTNPAQLKGGGDGVHRT